MKITTKTKAGGYGKIASGNAESAAVDLNLRKDKLFSKFELLGVGQALDVDGKASSAIDKNLNKELKEKSNVLGRLKGLFSRTK